MKFSIKLARIILLVFSSIGVLLSSCVTGHPSTTLQTETFLSSSPTPTATVQTAIPPTTATPLITATSTEQPVEPVGCQQPSDDYTLITINDHQLNRRTYDMLAYAQTIYNGQIDLTGDAITQGSYTTAVAASFGTHAGGGAVDLSVMAPGTYTILTDEIEPLIHALRLAGFAAWYRDFNALYEGSPPHIHAIAIGDRELSLPAREQLAGPFGYFWGYDGLPQEDGVAQRDPHGGPILCDWMITMGYPAKTATPSP